MINKLLKELKKYTNNVYYVGGFVRDELLKLNNKDIDMYIDSNKIDEITSKYGNIIEYKTVHSAKGLESDTVIVLNLSVCIRCILCVSCSILV